MNELSKNVLSHFFSLALDTRFFPHSESAVSSMLVLGALRHLRNDISIHKVQYDSSLSKFQFYRCPYHPRNYHIFNCPSRTGHIVNSASQPPMLFLADDDARSVVQRWKAPLGEELEDTLTFQTYVRAMIFLTIVGTGVKEEVRLVKERKGIEEKEEGKNKGGEKEGEKKEGEKEEHKKEHKTGQKEEHKGDERNHVSLPNTDAQYLLPPFDCGAAPSSFVSGVLVSTDLDAFVVSVSATRRQCDLHICLWAKTKLEETEVALEPLRRRRRFREMRLWLSERGYGCTAHLSGEELQHWFLSREVW